MRTKSIWIDRGEQKADLFMPLLPVIALCLAAGCGQSPAPAPALSEIRGQPINSPVRASNAPALTLRAESTEEKRADATAVTAVSVDIEAGGTAGPSSAPAGAQPDEYARVGFEKLSGYNFEVSDEILNPPTNNVAEVSAKTDAQIPAAVKAFNSKRVALKGFMLPLKVEGGLVTELLVMKDQSMCCYGAVPRINEWVSVKMMKGGIKPIMDQPVTLFGTLRVGETRENGYLVGIYAMDGDRMEGPLDN